MFEINGLFESCVIAIDQHRAGLDGTLLFQQIAVVNLFTVSAIAVLARWLKMDAEETRVLGLDRDAEQLALRGRRVRACWIAAHLSTEVRAILANTEAPMRSTRSYS